MAKQYPYSLYVQTLSEESVPDDNGDYVAPEPYWLLVSPCRDEANSGGKAVALEDGTAYVYDSLIQLPKSCPAIAQGTRIEVRQGDVVRVAATVSRFRPDQLHSRLWV